MGFAVSARATERGIRERRVRALLAEQVLPAPPMVQSTAILPPAPEVRRSFGLEPNEVERAAIWKTSRDWLFVTGPVPAPRKRFTMAEILDRISSATGVSAIEIKSAGRQKRAVLARQAVAYWCARLTDHSYPAIARFLGGRDHTTIMHAVRVYPSKREAMGRHLRSVRT